jgi:hypothetical protein
MRNGKRQDKMVNQLGVIMTMILKMGENMVNIIIDIQ